MTKTLEFHLFWLYISYFN